jgi:hypothetical protein
MEGILMVLTFRIREVVGLREFVETTAAGHQPGKKDKRRY